jgi:hypothetical protein
MWSSFFQDEPLPRPLIGDHENVEEWTQERWWLHHMLCVVPLNLEYHLHPDEMRAQMESLLLDDTPSDILYMVPSIHKHLFNTVD